MRRLMNTRRAARILGCAVRTIEELIRQGELPGAIYGSGGYVIPVEAFYARVTERAVGGLKKLSAGQPLPVALAVGLKPARGRGNPIPACLQPGATQ